MMEISIYPSSPNTFFKYTCQTDLFIANEFL
jgi:hypothetical protein